MKTRIIRGGFKKITKQRGFAILAVLALLLFLTLITLALLQVSAVDRRTYNYRDARSEAEANARMALTVAIGKLQRQMGPDQRISARGETLVKHPALAGTLPEGSPQSWWVGVAHSDGTSPVDETNTRSVVWLVSGLDPDQSALDQITNAKPFLKDGVVMFEETIDIDTQTSGEPIKAGRVMIENEKGETSGAYAYFVEDNGMKAQLAASSVEVRNDRTEVLGGGVFPGTYKLDILNEMDGMARKTVTDYAKLLSVGDLRILGVSKETAKKKYFGYTVSSQGILCDVKNGGLKKDLTIAFENDQVFATELKNSTQGYIVVEPERLAQASELVQNGYIHWDMFRDFYNTKKHIKMVQSDHGEVPALDLIIFTKEGLFNRNGGANDLHYGRLGPHEMGPATVGPRHTGQPYGDYQVLPFRRNGQDIIGPYIGNNYKHSPIIPILSLLQQNAWIDYEEPENGNKGKLYTRVQLWSSHYNPYNISMVAGGDRTGTGPRVIHFPQVEFTMSGHYNRSQGVHGKRQCHVPHPVILAPGRSHVFGFKNDATKGRETDGRLYNDKVKDLVLESVYTSKEVDTPITGTSDVEIAVRADRPSLIHGVDEQSGSHEVSQVMHAPFYWDNSHGRPGKTFTQKLSPDELNENSMASFSFSLRTTRESSGDRLRPLVDGNIRALWCNTKWDSPLGLNLLASYSENNGVAEDSFIPMNVEDAPKGYSYWGADRDPADGYDRVILFDIPREDLTSLGQLQHAGAGRFSYEPSYIVGNSYANVRIPLTNWKTSITDTFSTSDKGMADWAIQGSFNLYDASYLVNEALWDKYIFTTIPQVSDDYGNPAVADPTYADLLAGTEFLDNPRFIPYVPEGSTFDDTALKDPARSFHHNAGHLLVDGAFNINSTSVDAWEAFLSGTHNLPYQKVDELGFISGFSAAGDVDGVRFPRVKSVLGEGTKKSGLDENFWTGFRELTPTEVRELAEAIVKEIKTRGPFLNLADFINRKLESGEPGKSGVLQAALDATVNDSLSNQYESEADHAGNLANIPENSTQGAGFPGQLLQGDVLQALSPYMQPRSDTFTIRAYGESRSERTGEVLARSWCEAVVQRIPEPVKNPDSKSSVSEELAFPSSKFGRQFRIISFRWLNPDEV